jgi:hypothetical protein
MHDEVAGETLTADFLYWTRHQDGFAKAGFNFLDAGKVGQKPSTVILRRDSPTKYSFPKLASYYSDPDIITLVKLFI